MPCWPRMPTGRPAFLRSGARDARHLYTRRRHSRCDAERARLRGMSENGIGLGAPAALPHLRACRLFDSSPNRHATKHFHATGHPVIEGYDPPEGWGWCYVDEVALDLSDRMTPHNGPIPRFF